MQNHTDNRFNDPLLAMLALIALGAFAQGAVGSSMGQGLSILFKVLASFSAFVWYCRDSDTRSYRRSLWRNILFNAVAVLFVPWYLLRTRARGERVEAMGSLALFCLCMFVALAVGGISGKVLRYLI